jgi:hypothetical protein
MLGQVRTSSKSEVLPETSVIDLLAKLVGGLINSLYLGQLLEQLIKLLKSTIELLEALIMIDMGKVVRPCVEEGGPASCPDPGGIPSNLIPSCLILSRLMVKSRYGVRRQGIRIGSASAEA